MERANTPLIVGAGPVGLAAALFLHRQGRGVRIVEMLETPSNQSRALAVNPRTLEILAPTGITRQMLELGIRIHGVRFYHVGKEVGALSLAGIHPQYPFMLALSQASTERLLSRALERAGCSVERGKKMVDIRQSETEGVVAGIEASEGGRREEVHCPWLLAADGAHSTAREKLKMDFSGSSLGEEWHLADLPVRTQLSHEYGHVFFFEGGRFIFMLRVVDETLRDRPGEPIWRIISNRPHPLEQLVHAEQAGTPVWESDFHISHRIVASMAVDGVYFAGDAAHLHSPIGARGMNLGLEDAWVFSELVRTGRTAEYDAFRRSVDRSVVRRVELLTRMVAGQSPFSRVAREIGLPIATKTPPLRHRMIAAVTGLDHPLPHLGEPGAPS